MQTKHQKNTAPGENTIHPWIKKKLPLVTLKYLLDLYNKIWEDGIVTEGNRQQ